MVFGTVEHKTNDRFRKMDDFKCYINEKDVDFYSEDVSFTGHVYEMNTPQFKAVERSAYAKSAKYMKEIVEYYGQNCYIPNSGKNFLKCNKNFTKKIIQNKFRNLVGMRNIDKEYRLLLEFKHFVKSTISTLVALMERE